MSILNPQGHSGIPFGGWPTSKEVSILAGAVPSWPPSPVDGIWLFPKLRGPLLGVPIIRVIGHWGLHNGPLMGIGGAQISLSRMCSEAHIPAATLPLGPLENYGFYTFWLAPCVR